VPVSTGASGGKAGSITAIVPTDYILRGTSKTAAAKGSVVNIGDIISSEPLGRARIVLEDGSILNLGSSSQITIKDLNVQSRQTTIELGVGRIRSQVARLTGGNAAWEVRTSTAICGVLGTDFYVEADAQRTRLIVYEGSVRFTPILRGIVAAAGSAVTVVAGQTSTAVAGAVAAPVSSGATSATAAAASTSIGSQGVTQAGTLATQAASRIGVVASTAAPAGAAGGLIVGQSVSNSNNNNDSNIGINNGTVSQSKP